VSQRSQSLPLIPQLERAKYIFAFSPFVSGYEAKDTVECSQSDRIMVRNRDSLMGRSLGLEDQVTTFLMDYAVTPISAQCFCEITAFKIPRQLHA
jgi:hypothetical protein